MEKLAKRELKQETPASYLIRLLVGVSFLFGRYGGQLLTARQMLPTGGRLATVSARLCGQTDGL
jgi:hypothetical protein